MRHTLLFNIFLILLLGSFTAFGQQNSKLTRKAKKNPYLGNNPKNHEMEDLKEEIDNPTQIERDSTVFLAGAGWTKGTVTLVNGGAYDIEKMNYDLERRQLQMIFEKEVKKDTVVVMDTTYRFYSFRDFKNFTLLIHNEEEDTWRERLFVNGNTYTTDGVPLIGLFEMIQDGEYQLLSKYNLVSYESLDVEERMEMSRNWEQAEQKNPNIIIMEHFVKKQEYYMAMPNREVYSLKGRRKKILENFEDKAEDIKEYVKLNSLNLDEEDDLKKLINFCNSLENQ